MALTGTSIDTRGRIESHLAISLAVLAALLFLAMLGMAYAQSWHEIARVALAYVAYAGVLCWPADEGADDPTAFRRLALAGAVAGFVVAVARPVPTAQLTLASTLLAAGLLGGTHWLALRLLQHRARR